MAEITSLEPKTPEQVREELRKQRSETEERKKKGS
jgi:hypothetical protein